MVSAFLIKIMLNQVPVKNDNQEEVQELPQSVYGFIEVIDFDEEDLDFDSKARSSNEYKQVLKTLSEFTANLLVDKLKPPTAVKLRSVATKLKFLIVAKTPYSSSDGTAMNIGAFLVEEQVSEIVRSFPDLPE